ncbi:MAG: dihydroorotase [Proteobacteria bacterium]|nr:MAG: dihydroorotase [Pseudomonadota bacterium]
MKTTLIKNTRYFNTSLGTLESANLLLAGNLSQLTILPPKEPVPEVDLELDGSDCLTIPGLFDLCASLREPGYKHKGTLKSETLAALKGGITTLCCTPRTRPVNDTEAITRLIKDNAAAVNQARVLPVGALTKGNKGSRLSELNSLKKSGCIAVSHPRGVPIDCQTLHRCFQYAKSHDLTVFFEPEEGSLAGGCMHDGALSSRLGLVGVPELAETIALSRALLLAEQTRVRLHIGQISCGRSVAMIAEAKSRGVDLSADVAIQNLVLTENDIQAFNAAYHAQPPLRTEQDRQTLLQAVNNGTIDAIVSQHQPHELAAKLAPFAETEAGMSNLDTLLSLGIQLVQNKELELAAFLRSVTTNPAKIAGINNYCLEDGKLCDLAIVNPNRTWLVNPQSMASSGKNSPFIGQTLPGTVLWTFVAGRCVFDRHRDGDCSQVPF